MITALVILSLSQGLPKPEVDIRIEGDYRLITANGVPNHATGQFPGRANPNAISAQRYTMRVSAKPQAAEKPIALGHQDFGFAANGVPFDPLTAEYWNRDRSSGWNYEGIINGVKYLGIDSSNAHVQPTGAYHYHGSPMGLLKILGADETKMTLVGWAADGFPIYWNYGYSDASDPKSAVKELKSSYRLRQGTRPSGPGGAYDGSFVQDWEYEKGLGDLDECNGRTGVTPEFPKGTYYYIVGNTYPWIPRMFKGTPDPSFRRMGPPPGGRFRPGGPPPPPPGGGGGGGGGQ